MGKPTNRRAEMKRVVEEFLSSGLGRREFCSQRGIALTTFDYWRGQFRATPRLVKVEVARPAAAEKLHASPGQRTKHRKPEAV